MSSEFPPREQVPTVPEGFYNPEKERLAVPRTEAARVLTRLVSILLPNKVNTTEVDAKHLVDSIDSEFQELVEPKTSKDHKQVFLTDIGPLLTALEDIGCGDYLANPYLKQIENFSLDSADRVVFNSLYVPWTYDSTGRVNPIVEMVKLRTAVTELPETTDEARATKVQALEYLHSLEVLLTAEISQPPSLETLAERLDQPNLEHLTTIRDTLNLISDDTITRVASITEATVAVHDADRELMKRLSAPIVYLMKSLRKNTKILADHDKLKYPEFWQLVDKYQQVNCAIGILNLSQDTIRRDLSYPI